MTHQKHPKQDIMSVIFTKTAKMRSENVMEHNLQKV